MNLYEAFEKLLEAYRRYYSLNKENPTPPFTAEGTFEMHGEQYFLMKSAKLSEINSNEHVFFKVEENLTEERLWELDQKAWETGLSRVKPSSSHRNTDVALIIITNTVPKELRQKVKKLHHYKSYLWGLQGWSNYRIACYGVQDGVIAHNRQGEVIGKHLSNIYQSS